jgi:diguanylate cyclase (GGDEF)-like protein
VTESVAVIAEDGQGIVASSRRPEREVAVLSLVLALAAAGAWQWVPDRWDATRPSAWWLGLVLAVAYALSERTIFHFEFGREAIGFSVSEVPTTIALVFLAPGPAIGARMVGAAAVLIVLRRTPAYKLVFNLALFSLELILSFIVLRGLVSLWGGGDAGLVMATIVSVVFASLLGSILVSVAISRFEGDMIRRITTELRVAWWLFVVNSTLAGMTLALALMAPALTLLAAVPVGAMWFLMQRYGVVNQRLRDLDAVHGFTGRVGQSLDPEEIVDSAVFEVTNLLRAENAALVVFDVNGSPLTRTIGSIGTRLPITPTDEPWAALVASDEASLIDRKGLRRFGIDTRSSSAEMIVSSVKDGLEPIGFLVVSGRSGATNRFGSDDVVRVQNLAEQLSSSLGKGLLHQRIEREARHDLLTGLPNRSAFERQVSLLANDRSGRGVRFVLMLDIDRFKEVNDTLGHHAGDELLVEFASRMSTQLTPGDSLARLAGDEFAIAGKRVDEASMVAFAEQCLVAGARPVTLDGLELVVTASIGLAMIDDHADPAIAIRRADIATYNAKLQRLGIEIYREEIDRRTPARLSMLGDLRTAIENDDLRLHYQPKLDLASGMVIGAEALVRWTHAVRGAVPAPDFVRVAEDTGLIKQLTDTMLSKGIADLRRFHDRGFHLGLSVNLSTHDLLDTRLPERVARYLELNDVDPGMLTLEITESALLIDAPRSRATIHELNEIGVRLSIDDFGTGYSSLSYLRQLPVGELKIDQSFIANMLIIEQDEVIVRSTIELGHNLGLEVVAEGVENNEILDQLRRFGCDVAQGFCISRPLASDHFTSWLQSTGYPSRNRDPLDPLEWSTERPLSKQVDPATTVDDQATH